ncbi:hypothetical protein EHS25_006850 [Saitozyma podzolica]|uniref:Uncharacterized protein n=1 Tax=Saitozyma podzolica TaxID=1890683 RepID=A0A427XRP8_9TREE|nr:hypothetical protein EHS25_006850 [Saitozyma podzolica]
MAPPDTEQAARIVRDEFASTWRTFYDRKPEKRRIRDLAAAVDKHRLVSRLTADQSVRSAGLHGKRHRLTPSSHRGRVEWRPSTSTLAAASHDRWTLQGTLEPSVPKYSFCIPVRENILLYAEDAVPFIPEFECGAMTEAKTFEYIKWHNHRRFDHEFGQDPDVDIILIETVKRLHQRGLDPQTINETRVLPRNIITTEFFELQRDLPTFPPRSASSDPARHLSWNEPARVPPDVETDVDEGSLSALELFCARLTCREYGFLDGSQHTALYRPLATSFLGADML